MMGVVRGEEHLSRKGIGSGIRGQLSNKGMVPIQIFQLQLVTLKVVILKVLGYRVQRGRESLLLRWTHCSACNNARAEMEIPPGASERGGKWNWEYGFGREMGECEERLRQQYHLLSTLFSIICMNINIIPTTFPPRACFRVNPNT